MAGVAAVLALTACTSTPESAATQDSPSPSAAADNASEQPPRFTLTRAPGYPEFTALPPRLQIGEQTVSTRLRCRGEGRRAAIPGMSPMTLKELARLATGAERREAAAVIVMQSRSHGILLGYNKGDQLVSRWRLSRLGARWGVDSMTWCAPKA